MAVWTSLVNVMFYRQTAYYTFAIIGVSHNSFSVRERYSPDVKTTLQPFTKLSNDRGPRQDRGHTGPLITLVPTSSALASAITCKRCVMGTGTGRSPNFLVADLWGLGDNRRTMSVPADKDLPTAWRKLRGHPVEREWFR